MVQIKCFLLAMGSSASVHKDPKSAMKLRFIFASKSDKLVSPSPIKDKPLDTAEIKLSLPQIKPQRSPVLPLNSFSDYGTIFFFSIPVRLFSLFLCLFDVDFTLCSTLLCGVSRDEKKKEEEN